MEAAEKNIREMKVKR